MLPSSNMLITAAVMTADECSCSILHCHGGSKSQALCKVYDYSSRNAKCKHLCTLIAQLGCLDGTSVLVKDQLQRMKHITICTNHLPVKFVQLKTC
jgi:hypothetical protein